MSKMPQNGPPAGIKLDTDGWIRCDHCDRIIHSNVPKIVIGKEGGRLLVYHTICYERQEKRGSGMVGILWGPAKP